MYDTLLVPLDGSMRAEAILPHVEELALRYSAKVVFLRVVEAAPMVMAAETAYMNLRRQDLERQSQEAQSYLNGVQGMFREKGIDAHARVVYGPVVGAIIKAAEREGASLVAMASHGRSGLSQVFYGSVAAGVLQRVDRPLLIIRSRDSV